MRALCVLAVFFLAGCGTVPEPGAGRTKPVKLRFGVASYATVEQARVQFPAESSWRVDARPSAARGRCSRFDQTYVTVAPFTTDGFTGHLRLDFINNRLYAVLFYPDKPDVYF